MNSKLALTAFMLVKCASPSLFTFKKTVHLINPRMILEKNDKNIPTDWYFPLDLENNLLVLKNTDQGWKVKIAQEDMGVSEVIVTFDEKQQIDTADKFFKPAVVFLTDD